MSVTITAVEKTLFFGRSELIRYVHSVQFHGLGWRCGRESPSEPPAYLTNQVRDSLDVVRPGNQVPAISIPAGSLVVQAYVAQELDRSDFIQFLPVTLSKVVNWPLVKGDMGYYESSVTRGTDEHQYLKRLPDSKTLFPAIPELHELLIPKLIDIQSEFDKLESYAFYFGETGYGNSESFRLSESMFERYPIIGIAGTTLFRSDFFSPIAQYFDADFFCQCERVIG